MLRLSKHERGLFQRAPEPFHLFVLAAVLCGAVLATGCDDSSPSRGNEANQWTMLAHDLSSTFHNPGEDTLSVANAGTLVEAWNFTAAGTVNGAPAVVDGVVYALSSGGTYALDAETGAVLWQNVEVAGSSSPTFSDGALFLNDGKAMVHALDAESGVEEWRARVDSHPFAAGFSSPVVFERYVIVGSSSIEEAAVSAGATFRGGVVAFDRNTGEEIWRFYTADPPFNGASVWSTVSVDSEARLVFASTGNNYTGEAGPTSDSIFALELDTGNLRWLTQLTEGDVFTILNPQSPDTDFGTNPILFEATIGGTTRKLLGAGQKSGVFWVLDRANGDVVWNRAVSPGSALSGGIFNNGAYDGERIIVVGNNGKSAGPGSEPSNNSSAPGATAVLMAMNPADGTVLWERQLPAWAWAPVTIANHVGFVSVDKDLQAFNAQTGEKLATFATNGTITSAPAVAGGRVYFGSGLSYFVGARDRSLHALALPDEFTPGPTPSPTPSETPGGVAFSTIYDQIIVEDGCNTAFCHGGNQGNLSMTSKEEAYANLVGVPAAGASCAGSGLNRVEPGDPSRSLLFDKISQARPVCGELMPPGAMLSEQEIEQVRNWIERGAPND